MGKSYWHKWIKYAGIRAIKTVAQVVVSMLMVDGVAVGFNEINWTMLGWTALVSGVVSLLTSLGGLPEVKAPEIEED